MQNFVGKHIDRYHITERLGMGGMAVVYKAYDTRLERDIAIKLIRTEAIPPEQSERLTQRFEREARSMAKMRHPNIVHIFDYGEVDGTPYLVMEYLPGGTLKQYTGRPMDYRQAAALLAPIGDALAFAHQQGVIHRDVKPSNIIISQTGVPLLSDFGIAKLLEDQDASLTSTGYGVGTPQYMAPEQWQNEIYPQTDIYALGIIFYELITGQKPYNADTPAAIAIQQVTEPLVRPKTFIADLPESVEKVLFKALTLDPQNRHPDMGAFAAELASIGTGNLERIQHPGSIPNLTEDLTFDQFGEYTTIDQLDASPTSPSNAASAQPRKRKTWLVALIIALVLVCLTGAVFGTTQLIGLFDRDGRADAIPVLESAIENTAASGFPETEQAILAGETALSTEAAIPSAMLITPVPDATTTPENTPTQTPGIGSSLTRNSDGMLMMYVPAGTFIMGSVNNDPDAFAHEKPQHEVSLDAYWMDAYEVSNAMFADFVAQTGQRTLAESQGFSYMYDSSWKWTPAEGINWRYPLGDGHYAEDTLPVVHVAYEDAAAYCQWAGARLPTEAEWEKAARGKDGWIYPWGNTFDGNFLRFGSQTGPVSIDRFTEGKSPYGIYNMAGNAFEWTNDWYRVDYYAISSRDNPAGPSSGEYRVIRGGSWNNSQKNVRSAHRDFSLPNYMNHLLGFRCVLDAE